MLALAEFQSYTYGLPEEATPPDLMTRWVAGEDVTAPELLICLRGEAADAASGSDEALHIVRLAIERVTRLFPELAPISGNDDSSTHT